MRYIGKTKANLIAGIAAVAVTLCIRHLIYTSDSNLLIVSATFIFVYTVIFLITNLVVSLLPKKRP